MISLATLLLFAQPAEPPPATEPEPPQQQEPAKPPAKATSPEGVSSFGDEEGEDGAPPPRTGFQMMIRTGASIPFGSVGADAKDATSKTAMSDVFSLQVPFMLDLGGKPIKNLFVGGYLGFAFGGAGGKQADACSQANAGCVAVSFRLGIEVQYHIQPAAKLNPWVGYGIGFEGNAVSGNSNGQAVTESVGGPEFAHLSGGFDFRISKGFGIGPMADFSLGQYTHLKVESGGTTLEGDIKNKTLHEWITVGLRMVIFP